MEKSLHESLSYEQFKLMEILSENDGIEASDVAKKADCSWNEMHLLHDNGLINIGMERLSPKECHPVITDEGKKILLWAKESNII